MGSHLCYLKCAKMKNYGRKIFELILALIWRLQTRKADFILRLFHSAQKVPVCNLHRVLERLPCCLERPYRCHLCAFSAVYNNRETLQMGLCEHHDDRQ